VPLWLALLLKRQRRANILPPPWLHPTSLEYILKYETEISREAFSPPAPLPPASSAAATTSPPFLPSATADAPAEGLPFHWLELGEILLDAASDDIVDPDTVRRLMRDLREARMAKIRAGVSVLDASSTVSLKGVGGMEVCESRAFIVGVIDGLRCVACLWLFVEVEGELWD
jgi:GINS complex subunit 2